MSETPAKKARRAEPIDTRIAKNGTKSYTFIVDVGVKPDGSRDRQRFTYPTYAKARSEYRRITREVAEGRYVGKTNTTVGEYIGSWLAGRRDVRRVTSEGYMYALKPVVDRLGELPIQRLTKAHVEELVEWRLTGGRGGRAAPSDMAAQVLAYVAASPDGRRYAEVTSRFGEKAGRNLDRLLAAGKVTRPARGRYMAAADNEAAPAPEPQGVAARTVVTMLVQLSAVLDDAMEQGLVPRNVARMVKRPDVEETEMEVWTKEESRTFRRHVREHRLYALFLLSLCGLRRSEIMGLRWTRIEGNTLYVRRGRVAIGKDTEEGDPKSTRSRRALPLPPDVAAALARLKLAQKAESLAVGVPWTDDRLVAVREDGEPYRPEWYSDEFQRQAAAAGVPVIRLHDARHTAATILLDSGASSVAAVAKWLGHDPAVLLRVYAHPYPEELEAAGVALFDDGEATGT